MLAPCDEGVCCPRGRLIAGVMSPLRVGSGLCAASAPLNQSLFGMSPRTPARGHLVASRQRPVLIFVPGAAAALGAAT